MSFQKEIWNYYLHHKRILPWRETTNPYFILVSEMLLQQTQVSRVIPKYNQFISEVPTIKDLATSSFQKILQLWQGLGYNRRARYLHESAQIIEKKHKGIIPSDITILQKLPGLGLSTASAILVFSYNQPLIFIETNIRRVYIHSFFHDSKKVDDKDILPIVKETLDGKNSREWYYALMDYGAKLGKNKLNPNTKSVHYTKQSRFEGSVRQIRGQIVRTVLTNPDIAINKLKLKIGSDENKLQQAVKQLEKENIITKSNNHLRIKD